MSLCVTCGGHWGPRRSLSIWRWNLILIEVKLRLEGGQMGVGHSVGVVSLTPGLAGDQATNGPRYGINTGHRVLGVT